MQLLLFVIQIGILFFLSQILTKTLSKVLYGLFKSQSVVVHVLSFLFLPGVVVHELSHLLTASILMVPTGEVEFFPEIHGNEVKMGSVAIAKTDPLRRFFIGAAPLAIGLGVLFIVFWYFSPLKLFLSWQMLILFYVIFQISNTMFSSKKDMEGALGLLAAVAILVVLVYILGIRVPPAKIYFFITSIEPLLSSINTFLFVAIFLDSVVIVLSQLIFLRRN